MKDTQQKEKGLGLELIKAVKKNDIYTLTSLIKLGADVNAVDNKEKTALILAVKSRNMDIMELLVSSGAIPDAKDKQKKTTLMYVVIRKDVEYTV